MIRSQLDIDNYTVNDIDWYEAEKRFIGFIEDHNGVIRIEESRARRWSYWGGLHSDDGNPFEGIKNIVGGREKLLVALPDNDSAGFLYMTIDSGSDSSGSICDESEELISSSS